MIATIILWSMSCLFVGFLLGVAFWEYDIGKTYDKCINDILASNRRLRMELSQRENKTRVEGDEWKDG